MNYSDLTTPTQMISQPETVPLAHINPAARTQPFTGGWTFIPGDQPGAHSRFFDDSPYERVDLPHDYSLTQAFTPTQEAQNGYLPGGIAWYRKQFFLPKELAHKHISFYFDGVYMDCTVFINGVEIARHPNGYTPFSINATDALRCGKFNVICIKVNHHTPSSRWYSGSGIYRSIDLVITNPIHISSDGICVRTSSRTTQGTTITVAIDTALCNSGSEDATVTIAHSISPLDSEEILAHCEENQHLNAHSSITARLSLTLESAKQWSLSDPYLYRISTTLSCDNTILDSVETTTGFRNISFDPETGFSLNGENVKLKGVCLHHDQGALGAKAYRRAMERQIDILQDMGANTIRITHNPASRELIDLANRKGMLLIEELFDGWQYPKNEDIYDYSRFFQEPVSPDTHLNNVPPHCTWAHYDVMSTLRRDRNAPSIIMWSLGNEIGEGTGTHSILSNYRDVQAQLIKWVQDLDPTRPVTRGCNQLKQSGEPQQAALELMDELVFAGGITGINYGSGALYDALHSHYPSWPLYASETASAVNSRSIYSRACQLDNEKTSDKRLTSYDASKVPWGTTASSAWYEVITRDFLAGEMVWTGFDYIGEPTPWNGITPGAVGSWPSPKNSYFGIIDTAGFPKDSFYFYRSQWNEETRTLHLLPTWDKEAISLDSNGFVPVVIYTSAPTVELFFTPQSAPARRLIGRKTFTRKTTPAGYSYKVYTGDDASTIASENLYFTFLVPYAEGTLEAVAYDEDGKELVNTSGRRKVTTTTSPYRLKAQVDRPSIQADNEDLAYVSVDITDEAGRSISNAENEVTFQTTGPCIFQGTDNGEQADHTSYLSTTRKAFGGKVLGIVKSTRIPGQCQVEVSSPGLFPAQVCFVTTPTSTTPPFDSILSYLYPRHFYVRLGHQPVLPESIVAIDAVNRRKDISVRWQMEDFSREGSSTIQGLTSTGDSVDATVTVLGDIACILNTSLVTTLGHRPELPATGLGVKPDGSVVDSAFPISWDVLSPAALQQETTVTIQGTARVFDTSYPVHATLRIARPTTTVGGNIASAATVVQRPQRSQNHSLLDPLIDAASTVQPTDPVFWSNSSTTAPPSRPTEILFGYATEQIFSQFVVFFYSDGINFHYPQPGAICFATGDAADGCWHTLTLDETIGQEDHEVTAYSYEPSSPVSATYIKLSIPAGLSVAISEVELMGSTMQKVQAHAQAGIAELTVGGVEVPQNALDSWEYHVGDFTQVEVEPADNSAITVLEEYEGIRPIIVESEDHRDRRIFRIIKDSEDEEGSSSGGR